MQGRWQMQQTTCTCCSTRYPKQKGLAWGPAESLRLWSPACSPSSLDPQVAQVWWSQIEAEFPDRLCLGAERLRQTCRIAPADFMIISSAATCHRGNSVMVCLNLQVSSPTSGKRSMRTAKLNWFVLAPGLQCGKIYLWLSHTNLVDSMLAFYLIFSRSLHNKYKSRMHKQNTWHLQFILVTENLIDE